MLHVTSTILYSWFVGAWWIIRDSYFMPNSKT